MKTTAIYHSADYDGIFCREIARKFLPEALLIGWNFGDEPVELPEEGLIYVLDLPLDRPFGFSFPHDPIPFNNDRVVWIDHHASTIASHPSNFPGYRIDGVAACRLAWQWFVFMEVCVREGWIAPYPISLPEKAAYVERRVAEPLAVRMAGEYDIWDKRDPDAETLQYGLRASLWEGADFWEGLLNCGLVGDSAVKELLYDGRVAQRYATRIDADLVKNRSYRMEWKGLNWIVLNTGRFNSLTFSALDKPETGHDALLGYMFNGKSWTISMYHARHRTDIDLSKIAVKYGGGGHKGACGFVCQKLPF